MAAGGTPTAASIAETADGNADSNRSASRTGSSTGSLDRSLVNRRTCRRPNRISVPYQSPSLVVDFSTRSSVAYFRRIKSCRVHRKTTIAGTAYCMDCATARRRDISGKDAARLAQGEMPSILARDRRRRLRRIAATFRGDLRRQQGGRERPRTTAGTNSGAGTGVAHAPVAVLALQSSGGKMRRPSLRPAQRAARPKSSSRKRFSPSRACLRGVLWRDLAGKARRSERGPRRCWPFFTLLGPL